MGEQEPRKETPGRGDLFYLWHPDTAATFAGYGIPLTPGAATPLAGLMLVDCF